VHQIWILVKPTCTTIQARTQNLLSRRVLLALVVTTPTALILSLTTSTQRILFSSSSDYWMTAPSGQRRKLPSPARKHMLLLDAMHLPSATSREETLQEHAWSSLFKLKATRHGPLNVDGHARGLVHLSQAHSFRSRAQMEKTKFTSTQSLSMTFIMQPTF
jgi:hypothetical protein